MQHFLKILGVLFLLVIIVGLILDNKVNISREIIIDATPDEIHTFVNDLNQWPKWSPWVEADPNIRIQTGSISQGIGATQSWKSNSSNGSLTFTQSSSEGIVYDLIFEGDSEVYIGELTYKNEGRKTRVIWSMKGHVKPIIIGNYLAQFMDGLVGGSFESGLEKLKRIVEK